MVQVSVHADGESCSTCPPLYADHFQRQLEQQHTNALQTLVQHNTRPRKALDLALALGSISLLSLTVLPRKQMYWQRLQFHIMLIFGYLDLTSSSSRAATHNQHH